MGYHRCHGERRVSNGSRNVKLVLDASVWTVARRKAVMQTELGWSLSNRLGVPIMGMQPHLSPVWCAVRAARGRAGHLPHLGFLSLNTGTPIRAPELRSRRAARFSDVSDGGQSFRSSPSAGEPRTWRRETVDEYRSDSAGGSDGCRNHAR